jgi:hypothetical protein
MMNERATRGSEAKALHALTAVREDVPTAP